MTNADDVTDRPWLTLSQAAAQSGRHIGALRSMVRRERIPARKGNRNQWLVQLPAELLAEPDAAAGSPDGDTVAELLAEVAELRERLGHATGQLSTKAEVIAALEQQLTWHRQPFWRRWIG